MLRSNPDRRLKWEELRQIILFENNEINEFVDENYILLDEAQTDLIEDVN